ncbi:MAG: toxin-antitoxin system YwqK family antitoxin [Owenweeksia sp.]
MLLRTLVLLSFVLSSLLSIAQSNEDSLKYTVYYYEGGARSSEGYLKDGKPEGYWKSYYRNGSLKAEGNRKDYLLEGPWIFYNEDGEKKLEINYKADKKHGLRKTFLDGQVIKEEPFVNDEIQGFTREYYEASGELHREVPYKDSQPHGTGYEYAKDGRIITLLTYKSGVLTKQQPINRMDQQMQKQGLWISFHSNRNVQVEGPYVNNLRNGYWKYYQFTGDLQRVEKWVMGVLQENAQEVAKVEIRREIDPNTGKLAFKGAYRNGKPEGVHRSYDAEGNVISSKIYENGVVLFEGIVDEQGRKQGPWKEFYPDGTLKAEGSYLDDLKIAEWVYYYPDGEVEQTGSYQQGLPNGNWVWYHSNGQPWREEEYFRGQEDGLSVEYSDTGTVITQGNYIDGRKDGKWILQVNDHKEAGNYFDGLRNGKWVYYYYDKEETVRFEGTFENGLASGLHTYYYPNGNMERRGKYAGGQKEGVWDYFDEQGDKVITIEYENGEEIKYNGQKIKYGRRLERIMANEGEEEEEDS